MAQGFIRPPIGNSGLDLEDIGDQYFEKLLSRNFFQEAIRDKSRFTIHDLMHDLMYELAAHVAGDEKLVEDASLVTGNATSHFHIDLRHVCLIFNTKDLWEPPSPFPYAMQLRSLCLHGNCWPDDLCIKRWNIRFSKLINLRSLELKSISIKIVPDSIGDLIHLRSRIIDHCPIECLPSSIKRLWNLKTLILQDCRGIDELPTGITRLINLRCLSVEGCRLIDLLPRDLRKLKSLNTLSHFVVSKNNGLDALEDMKLRGELEIIYCKWRVDTMSEARKGNVKGKQLTNLTLRFGLLETTPDDAVLVLEELQPPQSVKELEIEGFKGDRVPRWMKGGFSQLPLLRKLCLSELNSLEYMDDIGERSGEFFPCLEELRLRGMRKLKGWWRVGGNNVENNEKHVDGCLRPIMFPRLLLLKIKKCPELRSMPPAPSLERFRWDKIDGSVIIGEESVTSLGCCQFTEFQLHQVDNLISVSLSNSSTSLKIVNVSWCGQLTSITVEAPTPIKHLEIMYCSRLREIKGLHHLSSSLEELSVHDCETLNKLPTSLGTLTSL